MNTQAKLLLALVTAACFVTACSKDAAKRGVQGESCASTADCGGGLACLGQECRTASSGLKRADKECVLVQCKADADCCPEGAASCPLACRNDSCVQSCTTSTECTGACVGGVCVDCSTDDDCPSTYLCIDQHCDPGCRTDVECPTFYACQSGRCEDVGCKSDRECIAYLGSVRAVCEGGDCTVPCSSDAECENSESEVRICADGECTPIGCETDSECRARQSSGSLGGNGRMECKAASESGG